MKKFNLSILNKYYITILLSFIILIIAFPESNFNYESSYDGSAYWGLNYLFNNDITLFNNLIFPWGPLSFLKVPVVMGNHVIYSIYFKLLSWFTFIYLTLLLGKKTDVNRNPFTFIIVLTMALFFQIDHAIITIAIVSILHFNLNRHWGWILLAAISASLGIYIKASIGIIALSVIFSQIIFDLFYFKKYKQFLIYILIITSALLLPGLILFHSITAIFTYHYNIIQLSFSYSGSQSLFSENNMFIVFFIIILFVLFPVIVKDNNARKAYWIMFIAFLLNWKYCISREDILHYSSIYSFIILGFGLITIFAGKIRIRQILVPTIIFSLFYLNMSFFHDFNVRQMEYNKVNHFYNSFFNFSDFEKTFLLSSNNNKSEFVLDSADLQKISNHSIDVYPWNLAYISKNNLKWKPGRQLLFLAYSPEIDKETASDFSIANGPEYLIFHSVENRNGGTLGSLDNRYMLSDEPNTIFEILNNYLFVKEIPNTKNSRYGAILFKKCKSSKFEKPKSVKTENVSWNTWITIPKIVDGIERVKINFSKSFFQKLKSFFYKDQPYFIEYKLLNGKIFRFNFSPETATEGIWVSPYFNDFMTNVIANQVQAIRFSCINSRAVSSQIKLEWQQIYFKNNINSLDTGSIQIPFYNSSKLFGKDNSEPKPFLTSINDIDETDSLWTPNTNIVSSVSYTGEYSSIVLKNNYSSTFILKYTDLTKDTTNKIIVYASAFSNLPDNANGSLVISYEDDSDSKSNLYSSIALPNVKKYILDNWGFSQLSFEIDIPKNHKGIIKVYIWNYGNVDFNFDDFEVSIYKTQ